MERAQLTYILQALIDYCKGATSMELLRWLGSVSDCNVEWLPAMPGRGKPAMDDDDRSGMNIKRREMTHDEL